jgi:hypothetical protein
LSAHRSARPRVQLNRGHLSCAAQWMLEGSRLRGVMPKNHSRLWLRRCHCRQLPHTGVSARLEPLAFPYQHEPPPKNLAQSPTSPTHQHRHRRPPSAFDPTTAAQPSRREPLFMPHLRPWRSRRPGSVCSGSCFLVPGAVLNNSKNEGQPLARSIRKRQTSGRTV